jgi:choline dehydrogenase
MRTIGKEWDYIVIGAGSAGCVVASRLSEDPSLKILVLDAGVSDWSPVLHVPAGEISAISNEKYNWKYPADPDPSRDGMIDYWSAGKTLGGSSSINGMMFVRGHASDFDYWAQTGCVGWDYASVLPSFKAIEDFSSGSNNYRGRGGPQSVSLPRVRAGLVDHFIESAIACGHDFNEDYNGGSQDGVAYVQASQKFGRRHSASSAFLRPAMSRANLEVRTRCTVEKIIFQDGRASGVAYSRDGHDLVARCSGEVILCAGAIGSPRILMHSGIGPAVMLQQNGISVIADRDQVGKNLMEHPSAWITAETSLRSFNDELRPDRFLINGLNWLVRGRGPATSAVGLAQVFCRTRPGLVAPNIQLIFAMASFTLDQSTKSIRFGKKGAISVAVAVMKPKSRGEVRLASGNPRDAPIIDHKLFGERDDLKQLVEGGRKATEILEARPLSQYVRKIDQIENSDCSDDRYEEILKSCAFRGDHASGTCRMGGDDASVVDPELRVRGVQSLRIADASIMPLITNGNTNAPTLMIGQKASEIIRQSRR